MPSLIKMCRFMGAWTIEKERLHCCPPVLLWLMWAHGGFLQVIDLVFTAYLFGGPSSLRGRIRDTNQLWWHNSQLDIKVLKMCDNFMKPWLVFFSPWLSKNWQLVVVTHLGAMPFADICTSYVHCWWINDIVFFISTKRFDILCLANWCSYCCSIN
jgi:hypothetical protein